MRALPIAKFYVMVSHLPYDLWVINCTITENVGHQIACHFVGISTEGFEIYTGSTDPYQISSVYSEFKLKAFHMPNIQNEIMSIWLVGKAG